MLLHVFKIKHGIYIYTPLQIEKKIRKVQICLLVIMYTTTFSATNLHTFKCFNFRL